MCLRHDLPHAFIRVRRGLFGITLVGFWRFLLCPLPSSKGALPAVRWGNHGLRPPELQRVF